MLAGQDCLCVMPTGGGKSLCYQLPAVAVDGLTLVVSPLIALMKDQVDQLQALGLPVTFINSAIPLAEQYARLEGMRPAVTGWYTWCRSGSAARGSWRRSGRRAQAIGGGRSPLHQPVGARFPPRLCPAGLVSPPLGNPTTIALTATATDAVRRDIIEQLDLHQPRTFITGFARPNLFYAVQFPRGERQKNEMLLRFLSRIRGRASFTPRRGRRPKRWRPCSARKPAGRTAVYHAGLLAEPPPATQEAFMAGKVEIVVATTAFGMGIDKRDVRFVVHYNLPGSLEAYYQEAGRAGRDGHPRAVRCLQRRRPLYPGVFHRKRDRPGERGGRCTNSSASSRTT